VLLSLAMQQHVAGKMEVVVADDGSADETPDVVSRFAATVDFPVKFVTHAHDGFRLARCRNDGFAASAAPYVLFLDGDCLVPPDHVAVHLQRRKPGAVRIGDACMLDRATAERVDEPAIRSGEYLRWIPRDELRRLALVDAKARLYNLLRHPRKPKLKGGNVGVWRSDYLLVNGFDETYRGWGCEDDDFGARLRKAGLRLLPILRWSRCYHLWHPQDSSVPATWREGANVEYYLRRGRLTCCRNGLTKRVAEELRLRVIGKPDGPHPANSPFLSQATLVSDSDTPAEVEVVFAPGAGRFSRRADCKVLVVLQDSPADIHLVREADVVVGNGVQGLASGQRHFRLDQINEALRSVA
jgi:glycosyltransferase involved in cell wall biosynthesis